MTTKPYFAFINSDINKQRNESPDIWLAAGYANGYVAIPQNHPLYGKTWKDDLPELISREITFTEYLSTCIALFKSIEILDDKMEFPADDYWVLGFDTTYCCDNLTNWPRERVIDETLRLKNKLEALRDSQPDEK